MRGVQATLHNLILKHMWYVISEEGEMGDPRASTVDSMVHFVQFDTELGGSEGIPWQE